MKSTSNDPKISGNKSTSPSPPNSRGETLATEDMLALRVGEASKGPSREALVTAEAEARGIEKMRAAAYSEIRILRPSLADDTGDHNDFSPGFSIAGSGRTPNDHAAVSDEEEVRYNVREVQWFNEQLRASEGEAYSINDRWGTDGRELLVRSSESIGPFALAMSIIEVVREPLVILDNDLVVKKANRAYYRTFSASESNTEQRSVYKLSKGAWNSPLLVALLDKVRLDYRAYEEVEIEAAFTSRGPKTLRINVRRLSGGQMLLMSIRDVTPRRYAEGELHRVQEELRQGQKMEVVGRLAGGVAHDFNNILTGILGFSELLMIGAQPGSTAFRQATEIKKASERGAALTLQLLAFSRRQILRPQIISLNAVILDLKEMLCRLIGDDIELVNTFDPEGDLICADPGQVSQVILNLAVNARDAMPEGGQLSIKTSCTRVDGSAESVRELPHGTYVTLCMTDTGSGMDLETQRHVFEPFFTTKPEGSGTGLGLATVFGIVNQSGGHVSFFSEPGLGTTFWIDFPHVEGSITQAEVREPLRVATGTETILVVEDDDLVRELVITVLTLQGYTALNVSRPDQALELCQSYSGGIDLILTDLLMPGGMDGRELTEQARAARKGIRVLLMSGYTTDALVLHGVNETAPFLQKPFSLEQLANKVREVLDADDQWQQ